MQIEQPAGPSVETPPLRLGYFKMGTEWGIGYRWHRQHGVDLSLNLTSIVVDNWISGKILYLWYPLYARERFFYLGAGAGAVYEIHWTGNTTYPSLEGVIGYEFFNDKKIKYFVQLGLSVPIGGDPMLPFVPAFSCGVGF